MVHSWPGKPGVTDPFLAPSASPGSRRQVSVPIPFREPEGEHSPMPTPMRIVCTTDSGRVLFGSRYLYGRQCS